MFETALIRAHGSGIETCDPGILAETLIFYNKVHIAANRGLLSGLFKIVHPTELLHLMKSGIVTMSYSKSAGAVASTPFGAFQKLDFVHFSFMKTSEGRRITSRDEIRECVTSIMGYNRESKRVVNSLVEQTKFVNKFGLDQDSTAIAHSELDNDIYLRPAIDSLITTLVPSYRMPDHWIFRPSYISGSLTIDTNLDFSAINHEYHKFIPPSQSTINPSYLLAFLLSAREDMEMAGTYMAELVTKDVVSKLIRIKIIGLIKKRDNSIRSIDVFQESIIPDCLKIREAINSGERSFSEFLTVLDKSKKFKQWLAGQNPDANLVAEYYNSVTKDGPMGNLPVKIMRYISTNLVGNFAPVSGMLLSAADTFLVEKLFRGWRPNHFVEGPLRKFSSVS